jgi:FkbM family methyltransferase
MRVVCVDPTARAVRHVTALLEAARTRRPMLIEAGPLEYQLTGFRAEAFQFVEQAVWSKDGTLQLFAPKDPAHVSYSALNLQHTSEGITVRSATLASLMRACGIAELALLKLDVEGAECEVLRSMLATPIRPSQLLVEFDQVNQPLGPLFWVELLRVIRALRAAGYALVHRERANYLFVRSP